MNPKTVTQIGLALALACSISGAWAIGCGLVAGVDDVYLAGKDAASADGGSDATKPEPDADWPDFDTAFLADFDFDSPISIIDTGVDDSRTPPFDAGHKGCPVSKEGPVMAKIDVAGGAPYCIDTTEVTNKQFNEFLYDASLPYDTHPACATFKDSTRPKPDADPADLDKPVNGINFCYALAYCHWAGRRLCGRIGGGHASFAGDDSKNEWFHACSNGLLVSNFPYGATFDATKCNTEITMDAGTLATPYLLPVKSKPGCKGTSGGHAEVFDMSGNVAEFDDYASDWSDGSPGSVSVKVHGGSVGDGATSARCGSAEAFGIGTRFSSSGFRCCADYVP